MDLFIFLRCFSFALGLFRSYSWRKDIFQIGEQIHCLLKCQVLTPSIVKVIASCTLRSNSVAAKWPWRLAKCNGVFPKKPRFFSGFLGGTDLSGHCRGDQKQKSENDIKIRKADSPPLSPKKKGGKNKNREKTKRFRALSSSYSQLGTFHSSQHVTRHSDQSICRTPWLPSTAT